MQSSFSVAGIDEESVREWWQLPPSPPPANDAPPAGGTGGTGGTGGAADFMVPLPSDEDGPGEALDFRLSGDDGTGLTPLARELAVRSGGGGAGGGDGDDGGAAAAAKPWPLDSAAAAADYTAVDYTPAERPRRYAFLYGEEDTYRAALHKNVPLPENILDGGGGGESAAGRGAGFGCRAATVEGVSGHVFSLTAAQYALLDHLFPRHIVRSSVLAQIGLRHETGRSGGQPQAQDRLACSTWLGVPMVAATSSREGSGQAAAAASGSFSRESFKDSFGSDMRLSFGSDWRSSLPDLDLLPDMLDQPISDTAAAATASVAPASASTARAEPPAMQGGGGGGPTRKSKPPKQQRPRDGQRAKPLDEAAVAKAAAVAARHEAEVQGVGLLPRCGTPFLRHFLIQNHALSRQARDRHRKSICVEHIDGVSAAVQTVAQSHPLHGSLQRCTGRPCQITRP